ncbi:MAG: PAS domain S-box protein [Bacteroidota bacterium]
MTVTRKKYNKILNGFGFEQEEHLYKLFRIYLLIGTVFSPLFTFVFFDFPYERSLFIDLTIPVIFFILLIVSFTNEWVKKNIQEIFFYSCFVFTLYAFWLFYNTGFSYISSFGFLLVFFSISIGIQNYKYSLFYSASNLFLVIFGMIHKGYSEIAFENMVTLIAVVGIVSFIIHYNRYVLLKKLKENRRETEAGQDRLLTVLNSIDSLVYHVQIDEKGNRIIRFVSNQVEKVLGLTVDEYITEVKSGRLLNNVHPEDILQILEQANKLNREKIPVSWAYRFKKENEYIWIEEKVYPVVREGKHIANIGISTDVTNKIKNENILRKSEEKYRNMIEKNLAGFFTINMDNVLTDCNDSFAVILGYHKKEEIINRNINDLYSDSTDKDTYLDLLKREKQIRNHESKITLKNGEEKWTLENVSLIDEGEEIFIEGTAFDITDLKKAQLEIHRIEGNLSMVINNIDNLVYSIDIDIDGKREINFLGEQVEKILGMNKDEYSEEIRSGNIRRYFHPDDLKTIQEKYEAQRGQQGPKSFTYRFWSKGKSAYVWLEEDMFPQYDKDGKIYKNFGVVRDVTEKISYEQALRKSEENYRMLFERNKAGVFRTTLEGKILECNEAFLKVFGYSRKEELTALKSQDLYFSEEERKKYVNELVNTRRLTNYELRAKRKDNSIIWVMVNVSLLYDEILQTECLLGTLVDITELKLTGDALLESEQKFRLLFEVANDGIFIISRDQHTIVDCNEKAAEMLETVKENIIGKPLTAFSPGIQPDGNPSAFRFSKKTEETSPDRPQLFYWRGLSEKGTPFDTELSLNVFELKNKTYFQVILRDVTARMKAETAVRESEERFKLLADSTLEGIIFHDEEKIIDANDQFAIIHGYESRKEILGKKVSVFFTGETKNQGLKSGRASEILSKTKTGSQIWLESKTKSLPFGNQTVKVTAVYNITDRKINEEVITRSKKAYEQLVEESPYGIFIHKDGDVIYANRAAFEILKLNSPAEKRKKHPIYDYLLPEFFEESYERRKQLHQGGDVPFIRVRIRDNEGNILDIETKSQLINYEGEKAIQTTIKNISAEVQLEKEKLRAELAEHTKKLLEQEIRERKRTEEKLLEMQQYTQNIINSSLDMIMATDNDNRINEVNRAALDIFGYREEELMGKNPEILYSSSGEYLSVKKALDKKGFFSGEITNRSKSGKLFTTFLSASIIKNNKGEQIGVMGVSRDITELKKAETLLKQSEEKYRDLFENATDIIQSVSIEGDFIYVNNSWVNELGYSVEDAMKMNVFDIIVKEERDHCMKVFSELGRGKEQVEITTTFVSKKGKKIFVEGTTNLKYVDGKPHSTRSIFRNITETKAAERKAFENAARIRSIFESSSSLLMWTLNKELKVTSFNRNFYESVKKFFGIEMKPGFDFKTSLGRFMEEEHYPATIKKYESAFFGIPQELEGTINTLHFGTLWFESFLNPIVLENGRIEEISCISHEITGKKEAEAEIKQSLREKEVLLKEVHHRVKNNLQVISSILNLQSSYVKDEKILQILRESQNRIKSMSFIHESLYQNKTFSYINFSEYIVNLSKNLVHSYQLFGNQVDIAFQVSEVKLNIDQAIPCGLIVNELVSNALKYAFPGNKKGKIDIEVKEKGKKVTLKVEDNGVGLPAGFDYSNTETLGLQLVVTLVEQLDGKMKLESKKGTGYLITFEKLN